MEGAYRWSPEIESRLTGMLSAGCSAAVIAEQIACSPRMARRFVMRWKAGLPLVTIVSPPRQHKVAATPGQSRIGRPGGAWMARVMAMSPAEQEPLRRRVYAQHERGSSISRISDAVKVPKTIVARWIEEWESTDTIAAPDVEAPDRVGWPSVNVAVEDWPADARFEDDARAARREPLWRPVATMSDRMSYCSNATSWLSA